ncbi:hypothetical protein PI124_g2747 [Phytophthora idaei]|nr:hypothetical protein PI124_g2747 [Phytophthora idaei]
MWSGGIAKQVPRNALRALAETRAQQRKNSHQFRSGCRSFGYSRVRASLAYLPSHSQYPLRRHQLFALAENTAAKKYAADPLEHFYIANVGSACIGIRSA